MAEFAITGGMGKHNPKALVDFARARSQIPVRCKSCGHFARLSAFDLMTKLIGLRRKASFFELRRALRCSRCKERDCDIRPAPPRD